jgi:hypothetical protein
MKRDGGGGWATWVVLALALVFGSFADEIGGDDDISLKQGRCLFCTANLYLTLPLVSLLALLLVRFCRGASEPHREYLGDDRRIVAHQLSVRARRSHGRA